ncbi:hypothetical protein C8R46DRAFT_881816, partial [Mycena filopes]
FPLEVRLDLKRGIAAKRLGDLERSIYFKSLAWGTAKNLPIEAFGPPSDYPYLKLTGIAIDLAGDLEAAGKHHAAYALYSEALALLSRLGPQGELSGPESLRAVGIAVKLGTLMGPCSIPVEEEEKVRVWAVEQILRLLGDLRTDGPLPVWISATDLTVPLKELGDFYVRVGRFDYAETLYRRVIGLLNWQSAASLDEGVQVENTCRAAQLMSDLASVIIRAGEPTPERRQEAEEHLTRALSTLKLARKNSKNPIGTCEHALAAALFNAGALKESAGDEAKARSFFDAALRQATASRMEEGVAHASEAISRLDGKQPPKA